MVPSAGLDGIGFSTYNGFCSTRAVPIFGASAFHHTAERIHTVSSFNACASPPSLDTINSGSRVARVEINTMDRFSSAHAGAKSRPKKDSCFTFDKEAVV